MKNNNIGSLLDYFIVRPLVALLLIFAILMLASPPAKAQQAPWGTSYGIGNANDDPGINGTGTLHGTLPNVRSNYLWFAGSCHSRQVPIFNTVSFMTDMARPVLDVYVATATYTVGTAAAAGLTNVWLSKTNSGLATNDVLVYQSLNTDDYQVLILGGGASSSGLVSTNGAQNQISCWTTLTNAQVVGDIVYRMTKVQSINPVLWYQNDNGTNAPNATKTNYYTLPNDRRIWGPSKTPLLVGTFVTNSSACWMHVGGEYKPLGR